MVFLSSSRFWLFLHSCPGVQRGLRRPVRSQLRRVILPLAGPRDHRFWRERYDNTICARSWKDPVHPPD